LDDYVDDDEKEAVLAAVSMKDLTRHGVNVDDTRLPHTITSSRVNHANNRIAESDVRRPGMEDAFSYVKAYFGQMGFLDSCSFSDFVQILTCSDAATVTPAAVPPPLPFHRHKYGAGARGKQKQQRHFRK
jgi:hypothetical protein